MDNVMGVDCDGNGTSPNVNNHEDEFVNEKLSQICNNFLSACRCCICNKNQHLIYHKACMHVVCRGCVDIVSEDICGKCMQPGVSMALLPQSLGMIANIISMQINEKLKCVPSNVAFYAPHVFAMKKMHDGETVLHKYCRDGNLEGVRLCLHNGADPNSQDFAGWTPLHETVLKENIKEAELLITYGALVNVPAYDRNYETPLFSALIQRKINMIKFFVENGADLNCITDKGHTVFDYCLNDQEMLRALCLTPRKINKYQIYTIPQPKVAFLNVDDAVINIARSTDKINFCKLSDLLTAGEVNYLVVESSKDYTKYVQFAILQGVLVVTPQWFLDFIKSNGAISPTKYILKTPGFDFESAAMNMFNQCPKLFSRLYFQFILKTKKVVVNNVKYSLDDLIALVKVGGGKILKRRLLKREGDIITYPYHSDKNSNTATTNTYVISNSDANTLRENSLTGVRVRSPQWFISCINSFKIIPDPM